MKKNQGNLTFQPNHTYKLFLRLVFTARTNYCISDIAFLIFSLLLLIKYYLVPNKIPFFKYSTSRTLWETTAVLNTVAFYWEIIRHLISVVPRKVNLHKYLLFIDINKRFNFATSFISFLSYLSFVKTIGCLQLIFWAAAGISAFSFYKSTWKLKKNTLEFI